MRLEQIAAMMINQLLGRMLRRALIACLMAIFIIVAIYHFSVAGTIALQAQFGALQARLIVGSVYGALALISFVVYRAMRGAAAEPSAPALQPREMQFAMLVEAVMLGYALARKDGRAP